MQIQRFYYIFPPFRKLNEKAKYALIFEADFMLCFIMIKDSLSEKPSRRI